MKKRFLCLALVMVMIFTLLPMSAFAADVVASGTCGENLTWTLDSEGTLTISGTGAMTDYIITDSKAKAPWFNSRSSIKSAIIENGVTSIGDSAFENCSSLTNVAIPDSVTSIGDSAFHCCSSLTSVTIGSGVTSIGSYAFESCSSLTSINVDNNNEYYSSADGVLFNKNQTTLICCPAGKAERNYTVPDSVTSIGDYAFKSCDSLTSVTIPDSVTTIGDYAFRLCSSLTSVTIPDSVTSIGDWAFEYCRSLTSITIPNSVTSIGYGAFKHCSSLTSITIPNSVTSIVNGAFYCCTSLTSITIPNSVTTIGYSAFYGCTSLTDVYYAGTEAEWNAISIGAENECLTNASIHYNSAVTHEHSYTSAVTEPTCTEQGYTTHTCACGDSYKDSYVNALGHSFGEWTVTTAPTCTEKGVETRYCSRCDATETRDFDALGHDFGEWTVTTAPTCTEKGVETRHCSRCDATETRDVDALGHALVHHDGKAATCTEAGWEAYDTCSRCDYTTYKEIPATGHSYTSVVTEPTCTEQGYTTHTCACGDSYVADYKDALGHSFGEWTVTTAPTCTEKGVETRYCSRCGVTETREVNALGHDYKDGVCTRCGAKDPDYTPPVVKENPFVDVNEDSVYYDAILWAYYHEPQQITGGYTATEFRPGNPCTRGQVVTFLWRAAGCPEPTGDTSVFKDASSIAAPYQKAVAWAVENGITTGYNDGTFRPNDSVTRAQFVTFLWRYENKPATSGSIAGFTDAASISGPYQQAVAWAVEKGITTGYNDGSFRPNATCTRWAVVLFMYRDMA